MRIIIHHPLRIRNLIFTIDRQKGTLNSEHERNQTHRHPKPLLCQYCVFADIITAENMTISKADDLAELGLLAAQQPGKKDIRKAYLRLTLLKHPDKPGGTKEAFQKLVVAYERLAHDQYNPTTPSSAGYHSYSKDDYNSDDSNDSNDSDDSHPQDDYVDEDQQWYEEHYEFFHDWEGFFDRNDFHDEDEEQFSRWHRYAHQTRREEIKNKYDSRDQKANNWSKDKCMFCGVNKGITKENAVTSGLNWEEYDGHPLKYRSCWACLRDHTSVMTKNMALKKFATKLDFQVESHRSGRLYHPVFWFLKLYKRSFHYQPNIGKVTLNSEYFWYPDLEEESLEHGWIPRGKNKDDVPWTRKDNQPNLCVYSPSHSRATGKKKPPSQRQNSNPGTKKRKTLKSAIVSPEKK
jgi:hypothetical protein